MRAYELMIIYDSDVDEAGAVAHLAKVREAIESNAGSIASIDKWGRRRFAYEINHKTEGYYVVLEILAEGGALDDAERLLRLADDVVRHKVIRLPEHEAAKRGLIGGEAADATPANAG